MINLSNFKQLSIGGINLKKLLLGGITIWQAVTYKNWVRYSTESDGTTIYNGKGYKDGYRVRSGGAEGTNVYATCTGYIPAKDGDVVRVSGAQFNRVDTANAINVSNGSFTNLGQITPSYANAGYGIFDFSGAYTAYCWQNTVVEESSGVWKWTIPPGAGIRYIRVSGQTGGNGVNFIVTINEEIA
jgi:hypothetical protein